MIKKALWLACVVALVCSNAWSTASAAHLKGHGHRHHKGLLSPDREPLFVTFLNDYYRDKIYAICVSQHRATDTKPKRYSIAFFDEQGNLLPNGRFCAQPRALDWTLVLDMAKNVGDWTEYPVDDQSSCLLFYSEQVDAKSLVAKVWCEG